MGEAEVWYPRCRRLPPPRVMALAPDSEKDVDVWLPLLLALPASNPCVTPKCPVAPAAMPIAPSPPGRPAYPAYRPKPPRIPTPGRGRLLLVWCIRNPNTRGTYLSVMGSGTKSYDVEQERDV